MARTPKPLSYDPQLVDSGKLSPFFTTEDEYFKEETDSEDTLYKVVYRILCELPDRQRSCVQMCLINGHSYLEASRMIGCSDQTVRRDVARAIEVMREQILATPWASQFDDRLPDADQATSSSSFFTILDTLAGCLDG
jgi:DNA-directed RNA polymerase specialized sigma24 family protein